MKQYPLTIDVCYESGLSEVIGVYSKGHHDKQEFFDMAKICLEEELETPAPDIKYVEHRYARLVPYGEDYSLLFVFADKPGPGAVPYTWYDLEQQLIDIAYASVKVKQG